MHFKVFLNCVRSVLQPMCQVLFRLRNYSIKQLKIDYWYNFTTLGKVANRINTLSKEVENSSDFGP